MDIPDAKPERKPFRFRTKWLVLFLALDAAFVAIGLWIVQGKGSDEHTVYLEEYELRLGAHVICPLVVNPERGFPDFLDSVWEGRDIRPLKERLLLLEDLDSATIRVQATSSLPFGTLEPVLTTMANSGARHLILADPRGDVRLKVSRERLPMVSGGEWVDMADRASFALILERNDSLVMVSAKEGRQMVRFLALGSDWTRGEIPSPSLDSLATWKSLLAPGDSIGVLSQLRDTVGRIAALARLAERVSGMTSWLVAGHNPELDRFLLDRLDSVGLEAAWRTDSLADSRGAMLCGLERLFFRKQGVGGVLAAASRSAEGLIPTRWEDSIVIPQCEGECHDLESFSHRDFPLPAMREGQNLVLREVQMRGFTMKTWPIWWALYDNGIRTSVWTFEGGMIEGKVLTNYQVDKIRPIGAGGFRIQVKGESYRNGSWVEKGVELDFVWTGTDFRLAEVGNRFGWFSGDVFKTEDSSPGGWTERSAENPPASLLLRCGYRDPGREGSPEFDWDRNLRITRCITAWPGAKSTFRPAGEKSFIER
ncbi:MAG: hypothetical protein IPK50_01640 [Fibrobacterota bacterium]|nr:MAG: hypothetical protein IPK50_01640 [Fibrobacterota bacterium]